MALSGSKTVAFCSRNGANRYYLKWDWTATQNIANNQSTVTVKLYIGSYGNGYGISSSASKSGSITIDGTAYSFTNTCGISAGGSKLLATKSKTITHADNGTKTFSINASFNPAVTISGTYQGNVTMGATSYTLNQIARASTISSNANWTFPANKTISISRKASSFTHTVRVYVGGTLIKTLTGVGTSVSTGFTTAQNTTIAGKFGTASATPTAATRIEVDTYSGSTKIGSTASVTGTCTATTRSTTTFTNNFNIGATVSGKITENNGAYTHSLNISDSAGTWIADILVDSGTLSWSFDTNTIASKLYAKTPNANSYTGKIKLYTKYNGVQVGSIAQSNWTWKVTNSNPTFAPTVTYSDIDTNITGKTGNNQYIVQNKSSLRVVVSGNATAKNSATMKTIQCTIAGVTKSINWSSSATSYTFDFGTVNASSNQSCTVQAVDSRGNKTSATKTVLCVPYSAPKLVSKCERANKFSTTVNVVFTGSYSVVNIGGTTKNSITVSSSISQNGGSYSAVTTRNITVSGGNYSNNGIASYTIPETSIATVKLTVTDTFGSTITVTTDIPTGIPTMYIDADKGNIAFNAMPDMTREANMKIGMQIDTAANQYWTDNATEAVGNNYGINMNNSDLVGLGGIFFNDICEAANNNEGIYFINTGNMRTCGWRGMSRLYIRDGQVWVGTGTGDANGRGSLNSPTCIGKALSPYPLADVGMYMTGSHSVTLDGNNSLYNQPTGWLLAWQDYDRGTSTKNNYDWVFTLIPKQAKDYITGTIFCAMPINVSETAVTYDLKKLTVTNTKITGHDMNAPDNRGGNSSDVVLRYVFSV